MAGKVDTIAEGHSNFAIEQNIARLGQIGAISLVVGLVAMSLIVPGAVLLLAPSSVASWIILPAIFSEDMVRLSGGILAILAASIAIIALIISSLCNRRITEYHNSMVDKLTKETHQLLDEEAIVGSEAEAIAKENQALTAENLEALSQLLSAYPKRLAEKETILSLEEKLSPGSGDQVECFTGCAQIHQQWAESLALRAEHYQEHGHEDLAHLDKQAAEHHLAEAATFL